nr:hypothetical protein [Rufibacter hautae]
MCNEPAVEGVAEYLGQRLVVEREALAFEPSDDVGVAQPLFRFQQESLPDQLARLVGLYHLLPVHLQLVIAHGCLTHHIAFAHLGLHARHALLPALIVVELGEKELDTLLQLPCGGHGIHRLGDGHHRDAHLGKLVRDVDGIGA